MIISIFYKLMLFAMIVSIPASLQIFAARILVIIPPFANFELDP